jgi:endonuclease/exonuclease/phosphatase family metal-dependent hydrolase
VRNLLRVLTVTVALLAVTATSVAPAVTSSSSLPQQRGPFRVLQMNLCLSGYASCYPRTAYPAVLDDAVEAVEAMGERRVDAVTVNEACSGDAAELARRTGLHLRFSAVLVAGAPLRCVAPGARGVFGLAVLTRAAISSTDSHAFAGQNGSEVRRWLCVTTVQAVAVCTAHLSTRGSTTQRRANDAECAELRTILHRYDAVIRTIFGGDLNRRRPCAPTTMWAVQDSTASQASGIQHAYGSKSFSYVRPRVTTAAHTDHDFLAAVGTLLSIHGGSDARDVQG